MLKMIYAYYVLIRLYRIYKIWPNEILFDVLPKGIFGQTQIDIVTGYKLFIIDVNQNVSYKDLFLSVAHEYRHMWQYINLNVDAYIQWSCIAEKSHLASATEVDAEVFALRFYRGERIQDLEIFEDMKAYIGDIGALQDCGTRWLLQDMIWSL